MPSLGLAHDLVYVYFVVQLAERVQIDREGGWVSYALAIVQYIAVAVDLCPMTLYLQAPCSTSMV